MLVLMLVLELVLVLVLVLSSACLALERGSPSHRHCPGWGRACLALEVGAVGPRQ